MAHSVMHKKEPGIKQLLFHSGIAIRIVNILTLYRIIMAPLLLVLVTNESMVLFRWMLIISFLTDAIDGFLARRFRASTKLGARLDSIGDLLTYSVAIAGLVITRPEFFREQGAIICVVLGLNSLQMFFAFTRYGKISSFHTYLSKASAILLSTFLVASFFTEEILYPLFYIACAVTIMDVLEEIMLVFILPRWQTDVKGLFWVLRRRKSLRI